MPGLSQNWEQRVLEFIFKQTAFYTVQTVLAVSLHTADPTDTVATALANEVNGNNYGRAATNVTPDINNATFTNWNAIDEPGARRITNKLDITFPTASGGAWAAGANLTHWGLWNNITAGAGTADQYIGSAALSTPVVVLNGQTLKFQGGTPGNLQFTIE